MFKFMKGLEVVECEKQLNIKTRTRGHTLSYNRESFKSRRSNEYEFSVGARHKFFINRVAPSGMEHVTVKCVKLFESKRLKSGSR